MVDISHVTAPTEFARVGGIRYAYRRFGAPNGTPLVFFQHFRGGMDHWDPLLTDGLAAGRTVILFDNAGVARSGGETPATVEEMADDAAGFVRAIGLDQVDVLGFSIGGYVAQAFTLQHGDLVRRLVLAGTSPRGGDVEGRDPDALTVATRHEVSTLDDYLYLFFAPSDSSQAAGRAFWDRRHQRTRDVDPPVSEQTTKAQVDALTDWREVRGERFAELRRITQPTLVVNGKQDIMVPPVNSYHLARHVPQAQLVLYPDAGHGSLFQYPELFGSYVSRFLDAEPAFS
jgi:pimeloyl-ACP methyl ester carboxylesterase